MANFVVSARKYRPALFNTVVGQEHITTTLKNAIKNNHLAQAFLFCGPRGVGKTTCARILAKTINCENLGEDQEACGTCPSCLSFAKGNSMNIHEMDAASNNSVDDIRGLVDQVRIPPQGAKFKIYIIDEVHMLSTGAFNAFLKTLEEPPSYAIFILATTEKHKILPTILSRCQIFDFNRIQPTDISNHLAHIADSEKVSFAPESLNLIAQKADGALRDALSIFDQLVSFCGNDLNYKSVAQNLNILDHDYYFEAIDHIITSNTADLLLLFDKVMKNGFDGNQFITGLCEHVRNLLVCKDARTLPLLQVSDDVRQRYGLQAQQASNGLLLSTMSIANKCDLDYKIANNQRLHVEIALLKLANIATTISHLKNTTQAIEVEKKK